MADTPRLDLPEISVSQSAKETTHNEALWDLDALVLCSVVDRDLTAPPGSPTEGDCYIPAATASGDWVGKEGQIAQYRASAWVFFVPGDGWLAYCQDENAFIYYDDTGTAWELLGAVPLSFMGFSNSPGSSATIWRFIAGTPCQFPSGLTGSVGDCRTTASAQTDFDIQKNGASVGTMRFPGTTNAATFIMASATALAAGDRVTVIAPASLNGIADVSFNLLAAG